MAIDGASPRFVLRIGPDQQADLFASWPADAGRMVRVLYSPPYWEDHPRPAPVAGWRIKTGCFPMDDTHGLVLTVLDGRRVQSGVVPPETTAESAAALLDDAGGPVAHPAPAPAGGESEDESVAVWDNEGGLLQRSGLDRGHPSSPRPKLPPRRAL